MCMQVVSTYASATASTTCITYHGHRCTLRQLLQHLKIATSDQDGSLTSTVCNDDLAYSKVQLLKPVLKRYSPYFACYAHYADGNYTYDF